MRDCHHFQRFDFTLEGNWDFDHFTSFQWKIGTLRVVHCILVMSAHLCGFTNFHFYETTFPHASEQRELCSEDETSHFEMIKNSICAHSVYLSITEPVEKSLYTLHTHWYRGEFLHCLMCIDGSIDTFCLAAAVMWDALGKLSGAHVQTGIAPWRTCEWDSWSPARQTLICRQCTLLVARSMSFTESHS